MLRLLLMLVFSLGASLAFAADPPTASTLIQSGNNPLSIPAITLSTDTAGQQEYSVSLQILLIMTALSFIPAFVMLMTSFTRIIIVFSILRQALGLTQDGEHDDDAGETGHQHDEGWNETQRRHDQQDLQADRILLLAFGVGTQGDRRDRQRIVGGKHLASKHQRREQGKQQNQQQAQRTHQDLSF